MTNPSMASSYTQGVCQDGAAILCDGKMMTIEEILEALNTRANDGVAEHIPDVGTMCTVFSLKSLLSRGNASYGNGGIFLALKEGKITGVSIDGNKIELESQIDALIADIDRLQHHEGFGTFIQKLGKVTDKYRSKA